MQCIVGIVRIQCFLSLSHPIDVDLSLLVSKVPLTLMDSFDQCISLDGCKIM